MLIMTILHRKNKKLLNQMLYYFFVINSNCIAAMTHEPLPNTDKIFKINTINLTGVMGNYLMGKVTKNTMEKISKNKELDFHKIWIKEVAKLNEIHKDLASKNKSDEINYIV